MKLQVSSRLAIFALTELAADPGQQVSVSEIGEKYGVSAHHLAKVMHTLGRAGLVRSIRGVGGGYSFCGNAKRTTLLDVIELFEDVSPGNDELDARTDGTSAGLELRQVLDEVDDIARATLGAVTLSTMLKQIDRRKTIQI
ncbi:MAG: Rrf2 family transcriptional regulator [Hyphomicrobiales bacterium]|nr:Rrf2 family transcriptional regulator [Hyphomicrobiales bacterium]MCP4999337.1 Rrf2 family transcriptional regulator [Hyphomicrobiales bacterium]